MILGNQKGYTLAEVMVALLLSTIVAGLIMLTFKYTARGVNAWFLKSDACAEMDKASVFLERELRNITALDTIIDDSIAYRDRQNREKAIYASSGRLYFGEKAVLTDGFVVDTLRFGWRCLPKDSSDAVCRMGDVRFIHYYLDIVHKKRHFILESGFYLRSIADEL